MLLVFLLQHSVESLGQGDCNCLKDEFFSYTGKAHRIFKIGDEKVVGLCGFPEVQGYDTVYYESIVFDCAANKKVYEWDATQPCLVECSNNILYIKELYLLPVGKNLESVWKPFYFTEIYSDVDSISRKQYYDLETHQYTQGQIAAVISRYNNTPKGLYPWNSEEFMEISRQLFWAFVSGSTKAGELLEQVEAKYGPFDGAIAEEFNEIIRTYEHIKGVTAGKK